MFFTGLRYHGPNETFLVQHGDITWRYWLRRVRKADLLASGGPEGISTGGNSTPDKQRNSSLPCRIRVKLAGLEWFVYNRSPAYDAVLAGLTAGSVDGSESNDMCEEKVGVQRNYQSHPKVASNKENRVAGTTTSASPVAANIARQDAGSDGRSAASTSLGDCDGKENTDALPLFLRLFPILVECQRPAAVIGNDNSKAILIVKAASASTIIDASETKTCDPYRQLFKVDLDHPVVEMKENDEFKEDQVLRATRQREDAVKTAPGFHRSLFRPRRRKILNTLRQLVPYWRRSVESFSADSRAAIGTGVSHIPGSGQWQGLSRYLDDKYQDDKARWSSVEYAAVTTILDSPSATFSMYWDVVTKVTETALRRGSTDSHVRINGSEPPVWGMSLSLKGGTVNYGPWADRQRADLQRVFYPTLCKDATAAAPLTPGSWRTPTQFKVFVEIEDAVTLRIPTREESKNWRWRGKEPSIGRQNVIRKRRNKSKKDNNLNVQPTRAAGWLELKVSSNASVSYCMDMMAQPTGYQNLLSIDLPSTELWSSVNHDLLWKSGTKRITCDLSNPLKWNALRQWRFDVVCDEIELYLLRDHVFLLTDLVDDWASGPPSDYLVFTPYIYRLSLEMRNLRLLLNINDENIIDKATTLDDNSYLILSSPMLKAETSIPLSTFRPDKNEIPFHIEAETFDLSLHASRSDTLAAFLKSSELGHGENLSIDGSYQYNATTSSSNTDTLNLKIYGRSPYAYLYGFILHYAILLKDNYFGDHVHFRTLDEYQEQLQVQNRNPEAQSAFHAPPKQSNDLDVILSVEIDNPRILLPANLYSADQFVQCELANLSMDVRFTNYYMDLELLLSPLSLSPGDSVSFSDTLDTSPNTQLFVDGVRVFGHRAFGLPPSEPTYMCNWDVSVSAIDGECTADFLHLLMKSGSAFGFMFDDVENALVPYSSLVFHDVTFLRLDVKSVHLWLRVDDAVFLLSTGSVGVRSNDWAGSHYSKRADISIPNVEVSCVNPESAARFSSRHHHPIETTAYLKTNVRLSTIGRAFHFREELRIQQDLIRREDQRTERTPFLLHQDTDHDIVPDMLDPPAQCVPLPAFPVAKFEGGIGSLNIRPHVSRDSSRLRKQSSFWSLSSSNSGPSNLHATNNTSYTRPRSQLTARSTKSDMTKRELRVSGSRRGGVALSDLRFSEMNKQEHSKSSDQPAVMFSSQYSVPHFSLRGVQPDRREAVFGRAQDEDDVGSWAAHVSLDDISPDNLSEDHAQASTMIEFPSGITAVIRPAAVRCVNSLLAALQPRDPDDIIDSIQLDSIGTIFSDKKQRHLSGAMQELMIKLPKADVRFLNSSATAYETSACEEHDQYDIRVSDALLIMRNVKDRMVSEPTSRTSLRFHLRAVELSASERLSAVDTPQAAIVVNIESVNLSIGAKDITYFDADIGSITGSTASGKIEYLASLIHRTGAIASELGDLLSETSSRQSDRAKHLVFRLLEDGKATNDPPFLIRPSAVLRSAHEHMRIMDSWKMIVRLRQIWVMLSARTRSDVLGQCRSDSTQPPPNAAEHILTAFKAWRSWDLDDPSNSRLMRNLFGDAAGSRDESLDDYPLLGACRVAELRFILDPGPKQNNVGFLDLSAKLDRRSVDKAAVVCPEMENFRGSLTVVNLCCGETAIHLNWELCELAEDVLRLYSMARPLSTPRATNFSRDELPSPAPLKQSSTAMHLIFEMPRGSIEAETINLTAKSLFTGVRASLLVCSSGKELTAANAIVHCQAVRSELERRRQLLSTFVLEKPSVFGSYEMQQTAQSPAQLIKTSASSSNMILDVKQDPVGLLEVLDLLIVDEAARLLRFRDSISSLPNQPDGAQKAQREAPAFTVHVAMFLERYALSIPLLQSLTYKISGSVARTSCNAIFGKFIIFDFDVKENSHEMQINVQSRPKSISLLHIPPANGRITVHMQPGNNTLAVLASMEIVKVDASAIYSLLATLNRPQISGAISEFQEQMKVLNSHFSEAFGTSRTANTAIDPAMSISDSAPSFAYNIHLALAGVQILAKTPLQSLDGWVAQILFALDKVTLQASNQHGSDTSPLKYPNLRLDLRQIRLDILRGTPDSLRSCGNLTIGINICANSQPGDRGTGDWSLHFRNDDLSVKFSPETVSTIIDVIGYLGSKIRDLDTSRELGYLRRLRQNKPKIRINDDQEDWGQESDILESVLSSTTYKFEIRNVRFCWDVSNDSIEEDAKKEDLVLSIKLIEFGTRTRKSARLTIKDFMLQTVPPGHDKAIRSLHSALLPEVMFNVAYISTAEARRMAFQAVGDSLDLRLTPAFIVPAANLIQSISLSMKNVRKASGQWSVGKPVFVDSPMLQTPEESLSPAQGRSVFGKKRLESLLLDADFAGAVVFVSAKRSTANALSDTQFNQPSLAGKYGQFSADVSGSGAVLRSPGLAWKAQYRDNGKEDPSLFGEVKINASSNILYPSVVPLVLDIMESVKEVVSDDAEPDASSAEEQSKPKPTKSGDEDNFLTADPSAVFGRLRLNLGLRICRQEFSLSCQPIARVAATAFFDNVYFTLNTVNSKEQGNFFTISGVITNPQASVQHVYSRDSTASFELESITISFMNSKHFSGISGVSAILKVSPMRVSVNAKQVQDFLLFREIWYPKEMRQKAPVQVPQTPVESTQAHLVQRYQEVAATAAFPWTATISIAAIDVGLDLGQAIGKSVFQINEFWISSKKTSDWEQNLCLGFKKIGVDSTGRLSGFVALQDFRARSSIHWPRREEALNETPLVQASVAFNALRLKAAFDYQAFLVADITSLEFLMYNVREGKDGSGDRLVAIFDGEAVQVFGTATSVAQSVALYQAMQKLIQERRENFETSLKEIEKFMKRRSTSSRGALQQSPAVPKLAADDTLSKSPISLDTDVIVTFKTLNLGVFPSTFSDHQVFKMEALNAYARFAASIEQRRIHSILRMTLGQLRIGLAGVRDAEAPKTMTEMTVDDVVNRSTGSRGGTILKVPRVEAAMETWQKPASNKINYIFKSAFEGKVEVGWNYSRISYIRGMWANHTKSLEQIWGRQIPMTAVKITETPEAGGEQQKITAEVNVPQSRYEYLPLEPPVIETPQLRDMGEATPPLEWIGLHRERLPNLTHQIVIVSLLELAGEVEDAYSRILGSS